MKPITDEIVRSLIERAQRRETAKCPANIPAEVPDAGEGGASLSGRIISFDFMRREVRSRQTVSGLFCYLPRV